MIGHMVVVIVIICTAVQTHLGGISSAVPGRKEPFVLEPACKANLCRNYGINLHPGGVCLYSLSSWGSE